MHSREERKMELIHDDCGGIITDIRSMHHASYAVCEKCGGVSPHRTRWVEIQEEESESETRSL